MNKVEKCHILTKLSKDQRILLRLFKKDKNKQNNLFRRSSSEDSNYSIQDSNEEFVSPTTSEDLDFQKSECPQFPKKILQVTSLSFQCME